MPEHATASTPLVITGADGRIGRLLRAVWSAAPPVHLTPMWCSRASGLWQDLRAGPLDPSPRGAVVLHLAADLSDRPDASENSIAMARAVAEAARRGKARHFFFASSGAVYAPATSDPDEMSPCVPPTRYGQAKLHAEAACRDAAGSTPVTALRIGNVIGAGALLGADVIDGRIVLDPVPGQPAGPIRSWIAPGALAELFVRLAELGQRGSVLPDVLNVADHAALGMADLLEAAGLPWVYGPYNSRVLRRLALNTARLQALFPQMQPTTPKDMIADWRLARVHGLRA